MNSFPFPNQPQVATQPQSYADAYAAFNTVEVPGAGPPKLENGSYLVEVTNYLDKGDCFIVEYKVLEANGGSAVGTESSFVRAKTGKGWQGYWARFLLANAGVDPDNKAVAAQAQPYLGRLLAEAVTKQVDPNLPVHLIGRKMHLVVSQGKDPEPGKKYYPNEYFSPAA